MADEKEGELSRPMKLSTEDLLRMRNAQGANKQAQTMAMAFGQIAEAKASEARAIAELMAARYQLGPHDEMDLDSGNIMRHA